MPGDDLTNVFRTWRTAFVIGHSPATYSFRAAPSACIVQPLAESNRRRRLNAPQFAGAAQPSEAKKAASGSVPEPLALILQPALARWHAIPDVAMQPPLAVATPEPYNKVFYPCLARAELQVRFANLAGHVTGDLEIDGLEHECHSETIVPIFIDRGAP
jgi:hypothetical protein